MLDVIYRNLCGLLVNIEMLNQLNSKAFNFISKGLSAEFLHIQ